MSKPVALPVKGVKRWKGDLETASMAEICEIFHGLQNDDVLDSNESSSVSNLTAFTPIAPWQIDRHNVNLVWVLDILFTSCIVLLRRLTFSCFRPQKQPRKTIINCNRILKISGTFHKGDDYSNKDSWNTEVCESLCLFDIVNANRPF